MWTAPSCSDIRGKVMQRRRQHELPRLHLRSMPVPARSRTAFCRADLASLARDSQIVSVGMAPKKRSPAQLAAAARGTVTSKLRAASRSATGVEPGAHRRQSHLRHRAAGHPRTDRGRSLIPINLSRSQALLSQCQWVELSARVPPMRLSDQPRRNTGGHLTSV